MGKRRNVDIVATSITRHHGSRPPPWEDKRPVKLEGSALVRCVECKEVGPARKAVTAGDGRWKCKRCINRKRNDDD